MTGTRLRGTVRLTMTRRKFLQSTSWMAGAVSTGLGSWVILPQWANAAAEPIRVGLATDLNGAIGLAGKTDANVAKMLVNDLNAKGGLLGRPWSFT